MLKKHYQLFGNFLHGDTLNGHCDGSFIYIARKKSWVSVVDNQQTQVNPVLLSQVSVSQMPVFPFSFHARLCLPIFYWLCICPHATYPSDFFWFSFFSNWPACLLEWRIHYGVAYYIKMWKAKLALLNWTLCTRPEQTKNQHSSLRSPSEVTQNETVHVSPPPQVIG